MDAPAHDAQRVDIWDARREDIIALTNTASVLEGQLQTKRRAGLRDRIEQGLLGLIARLWRCLLYTSPSPRD